MHTVSTKIAAYNLSSQPFRQPLKNISFSVQLCLYIENLRSVIQLVVWLVIWFTTAIFLTKVLHNFPSNSLKHNVIALNFQVYF